MNLYLTGFRGSGKSSVARILAETLSWTAVDIDEEIKILTGHSIADIFATEGEAGFRQWETTLIQAYSTKNEQIISLGGGAPTIEENRRLIRKSGHAVWLKASPEKLWRRICADPATNQNRPPLTNLDGLAEVKTLLAERNDVYKACADYTVDTSDLTAEQVADIIANWWDPVDR